MSDTATLLEITWTMIAVIALGFTAWAIDDNARNLLAVERAALRGKAVRYGPRWWVAVGSIVSSCAMFVVWLGFAVVGLLAMTVGPTMPVERQRAAGDAVGVTLVALTSILAGIQVWQAFTRTRVRHGPWAGNHRHWRITGTLTVVRGRETPARIHPG